MRATCRVRSRSTSVCARSKCAPGQPTGARDPTASSPRSAPWRATRHAPPRWRGSSLGRRVQRSLRAVAVGGGQRGHSPPPAPAGDPRRAWPQWVCWLRHRKVFSASSADASETPLRAPPGAAGQGLSLAREIGRPIVHQATPPLEQVRAPVGCLDFVLDHMRQRRLDDFLGVVRLLGRTTGTHTAPPRHGASGAAGAAACDGGQGGRSLVVYRHQRSTVSLWLRRLGMGRLRDLEPKEKPLRYESCIRGQGSRGTAIPENAATCHTRHL